jgi:hypothetical protein
MGKRSHPLASILANAENAKAASQAGRSLLMSEIVSMPAAEVRYFIDFCCRQPHCGRAFGGFEVAYLFRCAKSGTTPASHWESFQGPARRHDRSNGGVTFLVHDRDGQEVEFPTAGWEYANAQIVGGSRLPSTATSANVSRCDSAVASRDVSGVPSGRSSPEPQPGRPSFAASTCLPPPSSVPSLLAATPVHHRSVSEVDSTASADVVQFLRESQRNLDERLAAGGAKLTQDVAEHVARQTQEMKEQFHSVSSVISGVADEARHATATALSAVERNRQMAESLSQVAAAAVETTQRSTHDATARLNATRQEVDSWWQGMDGYIAAQTARNRQSMERRTDELGRRVDEQTAVWQRQLSAGVDQLRTAVQVEAASQAATTTAAIDRKIADELRKLQHAATSGPGAVAVAALDTRISHLEQVAAQRHRDQTATLDTLRTSVQQLANSADVQQQSLIHSLTAHITETVAQQLRGVEERMRARVPQVAVPDSAFRELATLRQQAIGTAAELASIRSDIATSRSNTDVQMSAIQRDHAAGMQVVRREVSDVQVGCAELRDQQQTTNDLLRHMSETLNALSQRREAPPELVERIPAPAPQVTPPEAPVPSRVVVQPVHATVDDDEVDTSEPAPIAGYFAELDVWDLDKYPASVFDRLNDTAFNQLTIALHHRCNFGEGTEGAELYLKACQQLGSFRLDSNTGRMRTMPLLLRALHALRKHYIMYVLKLSWQQVEIEFDKRRSDDSGSNAERYGRAIAHVRLTGVSGGGGRGRQPRRGRGGGTLPATSAPPASRTRSRSPGNRAGGAPKRQ